MNYEEELKSLKDSLDKYKSLKYKAEARLEQLNVQRDQLIKEIKSNGIEPEDLNNEIGTLQKEIEELFRKAEELLPRD